MAIATDHDALAYLFIVQAHMLDTLFSVFVRRLKSPASPTFSIAHLISIIGGVFPLVQAKSAQNLPNHLIQ